MTRSGRRTVALRWPAASAAAALLAGCGALAPVEPPMSSAWIEQVPTEVPKRARATGTLLVLPVDARAAYDTQQMAYASQPRQLAFYARHQWAERPAQMLQPLVVRTLEATGAFAAVATPPFTGPAAGELHLELLDLLQDFTGEAPLLHLALRAQLQVLGGPQAVRTREIRVEQPMRERSPQAGVLAANAAASDALRQLATFVLETIPQEFTASRRRWSRRPGSPRCGRSA